MSPQVGEKQGSPRLESCVRDLLGARTVARHILYGRAEMSEFVRTNLGQAGNGYGTGTFGPDDIQPKGDPPWEYVVGPEPLGDDGHDEGAGD